MRGTCVGQSPLLPAASHRRSMAHPCFHARAEVEITNPIHCLRGTLFPGRIVAPSRRKPNSFLVEYRTLVAPSDAGRPSRPYREEVPVGLLRPGPPAEAEAGPGPGGHGFRLGDAIDAFLNWGWWEGAITKELKSARFMVYFGA